MGGAIVSRSHPQIAGSRKDKSTANQQQRRLYRKTLVLVVLVAETKHVGKLVDV